jgi:hypothetical protein
MVSTTGAEFAIHVELYQSGLVVKDNAIYNHGNITNPYILVDAGATNLDIGFNSVYTTTGLAITGGPYPGDLWMVDPQFANVSAFDFHLRSTSPLIDRGVNVSTLTNDYDGTARPVGTLMDMGAFEYHP